MARWLFAAILVWVFGRLPGLGLAQDGQIAKIEGTGTGAETLTTTSATLDDYQLGIGDVLAITVQSNSSYSNKYRSEITTGVNGDGNIFIDLIGDFPAAGLSVGQLKTALTDTLKTYIRKLQVSVDVKEFKSQKVTVFGEAKNGIYPLKKATPIAQFMSSIGGFSDRADLSELQVVRSDGTLLQVDLNRLIYEKDLSQNILLRGGDLIIIPAVGKNKVLVLGAVRAPGPVYIKNKLTVMEAFAQVGGGATTANLHGVKVIRYLKSGPQVFSVDLEKAVKKKDVKSNILLKDGDIIFVPQKGDALNSVNKLLAMIIPSLQTVLLIKALN
ncbi:MAG: polysaccharide biosynthesis/export family protein [bacterium]